MKVARPGTLLLATIIAAPALWQGFVTHGTDTGTAMIRYLIAVPVAAVMLAVFDWLTAVYGPPEEEERRQAAPTITVTAERRRAGDHEPSGHEPEHAGQEHAEREQPPPELPAGHDRAAGA